VVELVIKQRKTGSMTGLTSSTSCHLQRLQRHFREWHANLRPRPHKHKTEKVRDDRTPTTDVWPLYVVVGSIVDLALVYELISL
jgi:hypothetical protein